MSEKNVSACTVDDLAGNYVHYVGPSHRWHGRWRVTAVDGDRLTLTDGDPWRGAMFGVPTELVEACGPACIHCDHGLEES
jgi:hypothetical protein